MFKNDKEYEKEAALYRSARMQYRDRPGYETFLRNEGNYLLYKKLRDERPAPASAPTPAPALEPTPAPAPKPKPVPIERSEEVAKAIGRSKAYEDNIRPKYGGGDESVVDNYNKDTINNTEEASKPYFDDDVDRDEAQKYADNYKLRLGNDFKLTAIA